MHLSLYVCILILKIEVLVYNIYEMEKLIKLLNEYHHFNSDLIYYWWDEECEKFYFHTELPEKEKEKLRKAGIYNEEEDWVDEDWIWDEWICSKKFWFIEWLVDNNKIDRLTFCTVETPSSKYEDFDLLPETPREDYTNILLMDLAIQDNPIKFLLSIIK